MTADRAATVSRLGIAGLMAGVAFSLASLAQVLWPAFDKRSGAVIDPLHFRFFLLTMALVVMPGFFAGQLGFQRSRAAGGGIGASATVGVFWAVFGWIVLGEAVGAAPAGGSMIRAGSPSPAWTDPMAR